MEQKEFDCRAALERLVARHPSLCTDPLIVNCLEDSGIDESSILEVVQELLLRPNVSVATIGCFRPIIVPLVDALVNSLKLLWRQGRVSLVEKSAEFAGVYVRLRNGRGWDIRLHEFAVILFSRLLDLAPYLLSSFLQYFNFAPPPFERLLGGYMDLVRFESSTEEVPSFREIIWASYRFLQLEAKTFRDLWDWSPFLELLRSSSKTSDEASLDIRWCAVQVVSVGLQMSNTSTLEMSSTVANLTEEDSFACQLRWRSYFQELAVEKAGMYLEDAHPIISQHCIEFCENERNWSLSKVKSWGATKNFHLEVCGIQLPFRQILEDGRGLPASSQSLVLTSTVKKNLEAVVLALSQRHPVLLEGPIGSGKSSLIQELAHVTGNWDLLVIHLDDQIDSKTLLGNYACTEVPGEFTWQPGALTQAVVRGMWVVFEDIDRAPFEIFSALIPLLEDRKLYIPGRGEMIPAAENFRIFSTVTRTSFGFASAGRKEILGNHWRKVVVDAPSDEELVDIIRVRFPLLGPIVPKLIETLNLVKHIASQSTVPINNSPEVSVYIGRQFSTRDLFKWCRRISAFGSQTFGGSTVNNIVRERIYVEAADCFGASIASVAERELVMKAIGQFWDVHSDRVKFYATLNKPTIQMTPSALHVGRAFLLAQPRKGKSLLNRVFANTGHAVRTLEAVAMCVQQQEPVLLVGETGTGKTSLVQHLARQLGMPLTVLNMSQQTDSADFLGGYKPVESQAICIPLFEIFNTLFRDTFPKKKNAELLEQLQRLAERRKWDRLLKAFQMTIGKVSNLLGSSFEPDKFGSKQGRLSLEVVTNTSNGHTEEEKSCKRKRPLNSGLMERWRAFTVDLQKAERQVEAAKTSFAFSFVEGLLVKALREGQWLLLDEINLTPVETLERLTGLLDGEGGSLSLTERGDVQNVTRHPNFRFFGCMNPATDFGKRDLPISLRNRFTELYVDELTQTEDLQALVYQYLETSVPSPPVEDIVNFYLQARHEAETRLLDGANQKPQYSLRSLARALEYTCAAMSTYGFHRSLYDGICMSFLTLLDRPSALIMEQLINSALFKTTGVAAAKLLKALLKVPPQPSPAHVLFEHFWVESGSAVPSRLSLESRDCYVLTKTIREHLKNLARAVFVRKYPVLLQGPTSSGKTSLVEYLATITGHRFVRINNHEHTDLQEYFGSYVTDSSGKLVFQEGILVEAVRKGYWIVLDELNLAPSDVLEALNRLLDDNRELIVPELQFTIKPHPHFMLFATQNPPGIYGGRKVLSRAFRNRFMELHVDDIPDDELCLILEKRCQIPGSYAGKMIEVMKDLQRHRQSSKAFAGKHGFITARDLFRWAERHGHGYNELARDGYMLLAERLRNPSEKEVVQKFLERHMRVKLDTDQLHEMESSETLEAAKKCLEFSDQAASFGRIVWTRSMKRLFNLVEHCIRHCEPVLLVGETGCGKTLICQLLSIIRKQRLHILNCHQHTETSDFLGGLRPVRERDNLALKFQKAVERINSSDHFREIHRGELPSKIDDSNTTLEIVKRALSEMKKLKQEEKAAREVQVLEDAQEDLLSFQKEWQSLFSWHDGPLVEAMRNGDMFLVDEISLADDSVLERLNSVLEPKRLLLATRMTLFRDGLWTGEDIHIAHHFLLVEVLAEKGGSDVEELSAHPSFRILATMNPGGDFGKKELSPALRNRFTEIWVPPISDINDLRSIVVDRFSKPELTELADPMLEFWQWFEHHQEGGRLLSVRDLLAWITYINVAEMEIGKIPAFLHGAFLVLLDGIGFGMGLSNIAAQQLQTQCANYLIDKLPGHQKNAAMEAIQFGSQEFGSLKDPMEVVGKSSTDMFGLHPFYISKGDQNSQGISFALNAPTTKRNAWRILRALQLSKPVLLEGSPGVGKTSLVAALAAASNYTLVRINLSEQTDMMDLLGSDLPVEGGLGAEFQWSDGIFLQALKAGQWVLLDELNLASQSVLEGLNACLDHRGELFIPELGRSFKCPSTFRIFACQNPLSQGGGRKGLPKSFLNRFTKVYMDALSADDYLEIASILHSSLPKPLLEKMIIFNARLHHDIMVSHAYGNFGTPWEFNLRDILRWCELLEGCRQDMLDMDICSLAPECFLDVIYLQRMRTADDRQSVLSLFQEVFGTSAKIDMFPRVYVLPKSIQVGLACLLRRESPWLQGDLGKQLQILPGLANRLESAMHCVAKGWMCILVGPPATGKTSLVRLLAAMTGNPLREFSLSSATDTTELLGCFEQHDLFRQWQELVKGANDSLKTVCSYCLSLPEGTLIAELKINMVKNLIGSWTAFQKCSSKSVGSLDQQVGQGVVDPVAVNMLQHTVEQLSQAVGSCCMSIKDGDLDPQRLLLRLNEVKASLGKVGKAGQFEWVDGGLLKAVERGDWVVLENANFCNPTVLDRLNPLLEPGGSIMINERGLVRGEAMVVRAHPNFRLFLTVDPAHGEVSRAMRNRGVELFMLQPGWSISSTQECPILEELLGDPATSNLDDLKILIQAGVPSPSLVQAMCKAHIDFQIHTEVSHSRLPVSLRELSNWVALLQQLLERGGSLAWCLQCSWEQTYARRLDSVEAREAAMEKFHTWLGAIDLFNSGSWKSVALHTPGGWPNPLTLVDYCLASKEAMVVRDSMLVEFLGVQVFAFKTALEWQSLGNKPLQISEWFQSKRAVAAYLPARLMCHLLNLRKAPKDLNLPIANSLHFDKVLRFASLWMIDQASHSDIDLRKQWLKTFSESMQSHAGVLHRLVTALEREAGHPVSGQLLAAWSKHLGGRGTPGARILPICLFGSSNQEIQSCKAEMELEDPENERSWSEVVNMGRKLRTLRQSLLQWGKEDELYRMSEKLGPSPSRGPVVHSYWQHRHRAERSRVSSAEIPKAMLLYLHVFFSTLRKVENELLTANGKWNWDNSMDSAFASLQEWHEALWENLTRSKFDVEGFLFLWSLLKRSLQKVNFLLGVAGSEVLNVAEELKSLIKLIDEPFLLGENPLAKPLLWKFAGHPELPHSKEVQDLEVQVMDLCQDMQYSHFKGDLISTDGNVRRLAMTALSLVRWLGQESSRKRNDNHVLPLEYTGSENELSASKVLSESREIYHMLKERIEHEKVQVIPLRNHDIVPVTKILVPEMLKGSRNRHSSRFSSFRTFAQDILRWPTAWALWYELLPWLDHVSILLDTKLLAEISPLDVTKFLNGENFRDLLESRLMENDVEGMIEFALSCSSRSPVDLVPHQHLLWILGGTYLTSKAVVTTFRDTVHELWVRWHSALWTNTPSSQELSLNWGITTGPPRIFQASQTVYLSSLLGRVGPVRDHNAKLTQLRVAALQLWSQAKRASFDILTSDFCCSSSLFQQIIFAHGKSFSETDLKTLCSLLGFLHMAVLENNQVFLRNEDGILESLRGILLRSQHSELVTLLEPLVLPCVKILYFSNWKTLSSGESLSKRGSVWLFIGELRLRLLLPTDGCDPVAKYSNKHLHLVTKSSDLELEIKVLQESEFLIRGSRHTPHIQALLLKLENMKQELSSLLLKLIPRPDPPKFRDLITEVQRFRKSATDNGRLAVLAAKLEHDRERVSRSMQEVSSWQETATQFIYHLSAEFPAYRDVVQPVQLAVYELKFGLSLLQAARLLSDTYGEKGVSPGENAFMELLCSLMQFPSERDASFQIGKGSLVSCNPLIRNSAETMITQVASSQKSGPIHREVLDVELKVMLLRVALLRIGIDTQQARVRGKEVLKAVEKIFGSLASLWTEIRDRQLAREKEEDGLIRFTTRTHKIETEAEFEETEFQALFSNFKGDFPDYSDDTTMASADQDDRKAEAAQKGTMVDEASQKIEKAWLAVQEPLIRDVVAVHRHIFEGSQVSQNLVDSSGGTQVDQERMNAFTLAYQTGVRLIGAVGHSVPAKLDDLVKAAHIMQVGLEYKKVGELRQYSDIAHSRHNIYRDPNPPEMALMLEPLGFFLDRVGGLLDEWPEHPILQQLLNIAKALVGISLEAPVMKALTGVELLLAKAQLWEENAAKHVSVGKEMNDLMKLVRRWRKLELESWPVLLKSTQEKHEVSAENLWFSLHGLLHRQMGEDLGEELNKDIENTTSSLEEFMQTSTLGQFSKRLEMVLSFHEQYSLEEVFDAPHAGASRIAVHRVSNILYNVWMYYSQFLPAVEETLSLGRAPIEKELKGFVKLTKWEDRGYYSLSISAEKTHRKLHKLIRKYDDLLKKSVIELITKQSTQMGSRTLASLSCPTEPGKVGVEKFEEKDDKPYTEGEGFPNVVTATLTQWNHFCEIKVAEVTSFVSGLPPDIPGSHQRFRLLTSKIGSFVGAVVFAPESRNVHEEFVTALDDLGSAVISRSADLRKGEKRLAVKKKALIDLLKALRHIGLSHHKSAVPREARNSKNWFQQPPSDVGKLLSSWDGGKPQELKGGDGEIPVSLVSMDKIHTVWTRASRYYFQNMALMQRLWQNALEFNKSLSLREVEVSTKYMEHLLFLQRKQRQTAYEFTSRLSALANLIRLLSGFATSEPIFSQQGSTRRWMWQQKGLLDSLCHTIAEFCLLVKTAEASQSSPSESIHSEAGMLNKAFTKLLSNLKPCKDLLDGHLVPGSESVGSETLEDFWPLLITPSMQKAVVDNFSVLKNTRTTIQTLCVQIGGQAIPGLSSLQSLLCKATEMSESFTDEVVSKCDAQTLEKIGQEKLLPFMEHYEALVLEVLLAVQELRKTRPDVTTTSCEDFAEGDVELAGTIQTRESALSEQMCALRIGQILDSIIRVISAGAEVTDVKVSGGSDAGMTLAKLLGCVYVPLEILQAAGVQILSDYVALQKTVSKLGYILSNLFSALYSDGFCLTKEEEGEGGGSKFEDADGTGMGEGEGKKDVSDQIEEEDQLLGSIEKNEDVPTDDPGNKKEKGIEMEQDFDANMLDLSDDESDEENNQEETDEKLQSKMGEEGEQSEVVDEQLWKGDDDDSEKQQEGKEKYEKDAPISGAGTEDLETRAKEDENASGEGEEPDENQGGDMKPEPSAEQQEDKKQTEHNIDDEGGVDQDEAYEDPTGVKPRIEEELDLPDDLNLDGDMDEQEGGEENPDGDTDGGKETGGEYEGADQPEAMDVEEKSKELGEERDDEGATGQEQGQEGNSSEELPETEMDVEAENDKKSNEGERQDPEEKVAEERTNVDGSDNQGEGPKQDQSLVEQPQLPVLDTLQNLSSDSRATGGAEAVPVATSGANGDPSSNGSNDDDLKAGHTEAQPDHSTFEVQKSALEDKKGNKSSSVSDSVLNDKVTSKLDRLEANPYRSLGDALKKWKDMVQLLDTAAAPDIDMAVEQVEDEKPDENEGMAYEYVLKEEEKGSTQALGAATDEQLAQSQNLDEVGTEEKNDIVDGDNLQPSHEDLQFAEEEEKDDMGGTEATQPRTNMKKCRSLDNKISELQADDLDKDTSLLMARDEEELRPDLKERSKENDSIVSLNALQTLQVDPGVKPSEEPEIQPWTEEELRDIRNDLEVNIREGDGSLENTRVVWKKLEQLTIRLSQELAEQLRLILEPTLAAKLQGDYRSGKRINMKKVIPYIASQFRKDKIWLRRTKASKRQYQVVLAIDDSRSMSESHCGHMALEALITICKAMSQLDIGEMAVASFGEKGNVRLLHDFDQPFSNEAGLNMVSRFTFKQDNTIADEPMVDLLHYLTRMLDFAARHAASPSGKANLQQLVLVIADGRFHEKESLRRCVRDAMNRKQLLAFLVLDNPQESILDMQSVSFSNGAPNFSKYLDSFPFPYYILLRDIESLPRTLADLLRQWFELMQRS